MTTTVEPGTSADDWRIDTLDLDAYLERVGQPRATPSPAALAALHEAHVRTIPFENVDPFLGTIPALDLESITGKLVHRKRGGYCYEHGLLFAAALERLGYDVSRLAARVQPDRRPPKTHMCLTVRIAGEAYLADIGFGRGVLHPMPLTEGAVVDQAGWPHRLVRAGNRWQLEKRADDEWTALHAFDETPQLLSDYEMGNYYVATHPDSPFTGQLVVMRLDDGVARRLVGDTVTVERADGHSETTTVPPEKLGETLRELDVELTPEELGALDTATQHRAAGRRS